MAELLTKSKGCLRLFAVVIERTVILFYEFKRRDILAP